MKAPEIKTVRKWDSGSVRNVCVKNGLYTRGNNEEYTRMLDEVNLSEPTTECIYLIAKDITEHSVEQTVSNVMFLLANQAVTTFYELDEE